MCCFNPKKYLNKGNFIRKMRGYILLVLTVLIISGCATTTNQGFPTGRGVNIANFDVVAQKDERGRDIIEMKTPVSFDLTLENYYNDDVSVEVQISDDYQDSNMDYFEQANLRAADYLEDQFQDLSKRSRGGGRAGEGAVNVIPFSYDIEYSKVFPVLKNVEDYALEDSFIAKVITQNAKTTGQGQACIVDMTLNEKDRRRISNCGNEQLQVRGGNHKYAPIDFSVSKILSRAGDGQKTRVMFNIVVQNVGGGRINNADQHLESISVFFGDVQLRCPDPAKIYFYGVGSTRQFSCWADIDMKRQKSYNKVFNIELGYDYIVEKRSNPPFFKIVNPREY